MKLPRVIEQRRVIETDVPISMYCGSDPLDYCLHTSFMFIRFEGDMLKIKVTAGNGGSAK